MRKLLSIVLALAIVLSVFAVPAMAADNGKTEVVFWKYLWEEYDQEWTKTMVDAFNEQSESVHVTLEFVDGTAWVEKMTAARAAGTAPDIYLLNYSNLASDVREGYSLPTKNLIPAEAYDDLYDNVRGWVTVDGEVYGYPHLVEPGAVMYYRKDLLAAAGYDAPPKTWAEHIAMAKALTTDEMFGTTMTLDWSLWGWEYTAGGHWPISDDWSAAQTEDYAGLAKYIAQLYADESAPAQALDHYNNSAALVANESVAIAFSGSWGIGALRSDEAYADMLDKIGVAAVPTEDGSPFHSTMGGWTYQIDSSSKNPEAAAAFITWLLADDPSRPAAFFVASNFSKYAVRKSVDAYLVANTAATEDEWMQAVAADVIPYGIAEPTYPWEISSFMLAALNKVVIEGVPVEDALTNAAAEINKYIVDASLSKAK